MIATLLRCAWVVVCLIAAGAAWSSILLFGAALGPWAAGVGGVVLVAALLGALHATLVAINFVVSRKAGDRVPEAFRLSPWQAVKTFDAELDASMRGVWFATPFLPRRRAASPPATPSAVLRRLPILFVHGYFCNRAVWLSFMRDAASRGYVCEAVTLPEAWGPIESNAQAIEAAIDDLLSRAARLGVDATQVLVVAHSMGGLAVRAALLRPDASRVAHVITLGTPHHGTRTARYGRVPNVVQMRRGSPWLKALDAEETQPGSTRLPRSAFSTLFSYHDNIVYPQETGRLEGAHAIAIGGVGHVSLVYDKRVRTLVFSRLDALERG